jgi:hypothetical protein
VLARPDVDELAGAYPPAANARCSDRALD